MPEKRTRARRGSSPPDESRRWRGLLGLLPGYDPFRSPGDSRFDAAEADRAVAFVEECVRHVEGDLAGKPLLLEPWQKAFVGNLFGWKRTDRLGREVRRYKEALLYVPRKNGKSPMCAAIALYVFFCDPERGQQDYVAAASRDQAGMLFRQCRGMIDQEPELASRCRVYGGRAEAGQSRSIVREEDASFLRVISADANTKHGGNSHLIVVDELHAQPDRELIDVLTTSTASLNRKQTTTIYITTADFDRPSICNEKHDYARKVRDGVIDDPQFLPAVWEADPSDDWADPATWRKANPNLGVSVSEEYLERECKKARSNPSYENTFKRLHLNLKTEQDVRWLPAAVWAGGGGAFDPAVLEGRDCWGGLDFGWRDDYAALALVFDLDGVWHALAWYWLPREGRRDKRAEPTRGFVDAGRVTLTPGNSTDVEAIYSLLRSLRETYTIKKIAIDPANARKQGQDLAEDGFAVEEFVQSKRNYNEPCRLLESLLKDGKFRHGGDPVLAWMASNVTVEINGLGEIMPKKVRSAEKIDGICALVMALGCALTDPRGSGSVYDSEGIFYL